MQLANQFVGVGVGVYCGVDALYRAAPLPGPASYFPATAAGFAPTLTTDHPSSQSWQVIFLCFSNYISLNVTRPCFVLILTSCATPRYHKMTTKPMEKPSLPTLCIPAVLVTLTLSAALSPWLAAILCLPHHPHLEDLPYPHLAAANRGRPLLPRPPGEGPTHVFLPVFLRSFLPTLLVHFHYSCMLLYISQCSKAFGGFCLELMLWLGQHEWSSFKGA